MHCPKVSFCPSSSFPAFLDVRDTTLGRNITTRFAGVCQFGSQRLAHRYRNFRSATRFQQHRFCACVKRACFSHFRHTHAHRFKCVLWAFTAFLFSRRATDAVFRKSRHLATFGRTDAPAQIRDAQKTGLLKFARGMGVQQQRRGNGRIMGTGTCLLKSFF